VIGAISRFSASSNALFPIRGGWKMKESELLSLARCNLHETIFNRRCDALDNKNDDLHVARAL